MVVCVGVGGRVDRGDDSGGVGADIGAVVTFVVVNPP